MSRTLSVLALLSVVAGCSRRADPGPPVVETPGPSLVSRGDAVPAPREVTREFPQESFARGVAYLLKQQSADGAWRSDVYATFKDGSALTPLVLCALLDAAGAGLDPEGSAEARKKAVAWLGKLVKPDGTIDAGPDGLDYPVYTAALTVKALSHPENAEHRKARDAWVKYIKERQLTEKFGWKPEEKEYGGWGYCRVLPKKPEPGQFAPPLIESNLSATAFALEALRAGGEKDEEVYKAAAAFVRRCQNWDAKLPLTWSPESKPYEIPPGIDGGFHFIYDDPVRNKAGTVPHTGRFASYGSTTADGLRALRLCGRGEDTDREWATVQWLLRNFRADTHPGEYVRAHEPNREAVYYYYAASVARAMREADVAGAPWVRLKTGESLGIPDRKDWSAELAAELKKRQRDDGSWSNPVELVRENDPVVATAQAVSALSRCRE